MAAPVVTGLAALILEYFPTLTPAEVKYCIENSTVSPTGKSRKPGSEQLVPMSQLSVSGGVINAFGAVRLASIMSDPKKKEMLKSTLQKGRN